MKNLTYSEVLDKKVEEKLTETIESIGLYELTDALSQFVRTGQGAVLLHPDGTAAYMPEMGEYYDTSTLFDETGGVLPIIDGEPPLLLAYRTIKTLTPSNPHLNYLRVYFENTLEDEAAAEWRNGIGRLFADIYNGGVVIVRITEEVSTID